MDTVVGPRTVLYLFWTSGGKIADFFKCFLHMSKGEKKNCKGRISLELPNFAQKSQESRQKLAVSQVD